MYKTDMQQIYNLIVGPTTKKLQDKAALDATFQYIKTGQDPIWYLMILKKIWFSNQYEQHPIWYLCLLTRRLYNTMHIVNKNSTDYLVRSRNTQKVNKAYNGRIISRRIQ